MDAAAAAVVYAEMKFPEVAPNRSNLGYIQQSDPHRPCPRWHWVALQVGWAGNVILVAAVIAMGVLVINTNSHHKPIKAAASIPDTHQETVEEFKSGLKQHLCEAASKENESCRLCPMMWQLHKQKCYWFSTVIQVWEKSKNDCIAKNSQLVVIYDQNQKEFIQKTIKHGSDTWIGLSLVWPEKTWSWVDDSPLNQTLSPPNTFLENSCGVLTAGTGINPEMCSVELHWICQKESVLL